MSRNVSLRLVLLGLLACGIALLSAARPTAAAPDAFGLTVNVEPAGKGTVNVSPPPPYSENQIVTLTASPDTGWLFDKWVLDSDLVWWDADWNYRVAVTAAAAGYARQDKPAEIDINFTQLWNNMGKSGTLDPNSIRVVEVDGDDNVIDDSVPFQFDKAADFNASTKARGTLVFIMEGNTGPGAQRRYHVYFDVTGKGFAAPNVPAQVVLTENVSDEGDGAHKIETPTGTWWYHTKAGGFSSLNDVNGNDWISYNKTVSGAGGTFRGIPNSVEPNNGGDFHPGHKGMTSTILNKGPLKVTIHVIETKAPGRDKWEGMFEFYPGYIVFTMLKAPYNYWVLYEGTPGGQLQPATDFVVRSDGTQTAASVAWEADLAGDEWVYVADPNVGRSIFLTNELEDTGFDSYLALNGIMTQLGLGRKAANPQLALALVPREFTIGLMDETVYADAKPVVEAAYKPINVTLGTAEERAGASLGTTNPVNFTITGQHTITAHFKPAQFTLNVVASPADKGTVTKSPNKAQYDYDEEVTLVAVPVEGWVFAGWSGDVTGTTNPIAVNVTKNMNVMATFAQTFTVTTGVNPTGGGTVTVTPAKASYQPGEEIQVTATANSGYSFTHWSGSIDGTEPTKIATVNGNLNIIANFSEAQFTFTATSSGNGSVDWAPKKALYGQGEVVTVTATPNEGYYLVGWTGLTGAPTDNPLQVTIAGNTAITAHFAPITYYTLTTNAVGGGTVTRDPDLAQYESGTVVTLTAVPDAQKRFVGWSGGATGTTNPIQVTINSNLTVTATFEEDVYPLTINIVGTGSVAKLPDQPGGYYLGQEVTLTALALSCSVFAGWSGDATGTTSTTTITIDGPKNVTATFTSLGPYTLSVTESGDGTVTIEPEQNEYVCGEQVKLTAVPGAGSVFAGWTGDVNSGANPLTLDMTANKQVTAKFIVPTGPFSDNFNACSLNGMWGQPIDPEGDGDFDVTGQALRITIPESSVNHVINKDDNNAPRVMQPADDTNFDLVVKFDSDVTESAQTQGILVEQDASNLLRFDVNHSNGQTFIYAGIWTPGALKKRIQVNVIEEPNYLRVTRLGDKWIVNYSDTGAEDDWIEAGKFEYVFDVARAGVYAGNVKPSGGTAPAFTAVIDYFQNTSTGPIAEDAPLLTVNVAGGGVVQTNPAIDEVACGQTVSLSAAPGLGWTFGSWSGDASGTNNPLSILINRPRTVTATFVSSGERFLLLPAVIK